MRISKTTHILFIALIIVIVFSGSLSNGFVWDDKFLVVDNHYIKSPNYLYEIFTTQLYQGSDTRSNFYRPFQLLSYVVDYSIWGDRPFGFHLTNLFLHICNTILLYLIVVALSYSATLALVAALCFGVCPAISGITHYVSARSDLLMALFIFLTILFFIKYIRNRNNGFYIISIASFILAFFCKEAAVISVPLLLLVASRSEYKGRFRVTIPYVLFLMVYIILRFSILNPLMDLGQSAAIPLSSRIMTSIRFLAMYLKILLFPYGLHMDWFIEPVKSFFRIDLIFSLFIVMFGVYVIRKLSRINNLVIFGALWFLLGLVPVLNIYPISVFFGEGWLYLPSVGFFLILGVVFLDIIMPRIGKRLTAVLVASFIIYCSVFTIIYGRIWGDSVKLFQNILRYEKNSPYIYLVYNNLGIAYYERGDFKKAIANYKKSISLNSEFAEPYNNLGSVYMEMDRPVRAIANFRKAIALDKGYVTSYCNLAHAYSNLGLEDNAVRFAMAAVRIDPRSYKAYCNLGYVFLKSEDLDKAKASFKKARELKKESFEPYYCLGSIYIKENRFKKALDEYTRAMHLGAAGYRFYNELGFLYLKNERFKDAGDAFRQSITLNFNQSEPHNNLGNLYRMFGYFEEAVKEYKKALKIEPDNKDIEINLEKARLECKNHRY